MPNPLFHHKIVPSPKLLLSNCSDKPQQSRKKKKKKLKEIPLSHTPTIVNTKLPYVKKASLKRKHKPHNTNKQKREIGDHIQSIRHSCTQKNTIKPR
jgi:hypothetical protein